MCVAVVVCDCISIGQALSHILYTPYKHKYIPGCSSLTHHPLSLHKPNISSPSLLKATRGPLRFKQLFQSLLAIKSNAGHKGPAGPLSTVEVRCLALLYELFCASQSCREVPHLTAVLTDRGAAVCHPLPLSVASFISCNSYLVPLLST